MPETIRAVFEHGFPFIAAAHGGGPQLNITRILEAVIIAAVLAFGGYMLLIPEIKTQFGYMQRDMNKISSKVDAIEKDLNQIKVEIAVERAKNDK